MYIFPFKQSNAEHVLPNSAEVYSALLTVPMPEMEAGPGRWRSSATGGCEKCFFLFLLFYFLFLYLSNVKPSSDNQRKNINIFKLKHNRDCTNLPFFLIHLFYFCCKNKYWLVIDIIPIHLSGHIICESIAKCAIRGFLKLFFPQIHTCTVYMNRKIIVIL